MKKCIIFLTILVSIVFVSLGISYVFFPSEVLPALITFGVITYHFLMRLFVGLFIKKIKINTNSSWFKPNKIEEKLFSKINLNKIKKHIPTWDESSFDITKHSLEEILYNTCQAEVGHEIIALLSYLPLLLIIPFNEPIVFVVTSVVSSMLDSIFVVVQRYNRPKLVRIINRKNKLNQNKAVGI